MGEDMQSVGSVGQQFVTAALRTKRPLLRGVSI